MTALTSIGSVRLLCVDAGYNQCFWSGQEMVQNMVWVIPGEEKQFFINILS